MPTSDDDPLMTKIREQADVICWTCSGPRSFEPEAWTKTQLISMIDQIRDAAEQIIRLTGITELDRRETDVWFDFDRDTHLGMGPLKRFDPYSDL